MDPSRTGSVSQITLQRMGAAASNQVTPTQEGRLMTIIISLIVSIAGWAVQTAPRSAPTVVFVCEHGAAKSVIAAAYFNKLAAERNLPFRATFRGTTPQDDLSVRAVEGLKADGVALPTGKPAAITDTDIAAATHIFAIGCTLPDKARRSGKASDWSDVPGDQGYGPMRDAIVRHVQQLLDQLAAQRGSRHQIEAPASIRNAATDDQDSDHSRLAGRGRLDGTHHCAH